MCSAERDPQRGPERDCAPAAFFFDVNETLSDLSSVADAFASVGAERSLAATWFSTVLRDGFALTSAGSDASFLDIATTNAWQALRGAALDGDLADAVDTVLTAFATAGLHDDVVPGLRNLQSGGHRLFTLSNGPLATAERLLQEAGLRSAFAGLLTVEDNTPWKPARAAYVHALAQTGTRAPAYLVAVHPWDIHGAAMAGLMTVWVNRSGATYPAHFHSPTFTVSNLGEIAAHVDPSRVV